MTFITTNFIFLSMATISILLQINDCFHNSVNYLIYFNTIIEETLHRTQGEIFKFLVLSNPPIKNVLFIHKTDRQEFFPPV